MKSPEQTVSRAGLLIVKNPSRRVQGFTESVIREMTRKSEAHNAVNLAQGFPDFDPPKPVMDAAVAAIRQGFNQYATTYGNIRLREAIARKMRGYNHVECNAKDNITVTCGTTEAMMSTLLAMLNPGDEVVIPEPFYENYGPDTVLSGAKCKYVPLEGSSFRLDEERLKHAFSQKTKAVIVNTPHNPTGRVFTPEELRLVADLCQDYDAYAVTDEVYEYILYDRRKHLSIGSIDGMHDRTVTISGFSKTYSMTGWRVGYVVASKRLSAELRKVHDFLTVCAPSPLQEACIKALELPPSYYQSLVKNYDSGRGLLLKTLREKGFQCTVPEGAYYVWTGIDGLGFDSDRDIAEYLVRTVGVGAVPGSSFYHLPTMGRKKLRFSFSKSPRTIREATRRLSKLG